MNVPSLLSISHADLLSTGVGRRDEILGVACDLFFLKGFGAASVRDIAERIGFTQAAIYYHFRSKDEILLALIEDFVEELYEFLNRVMHETGDPVKDLERTICAHILASQTHYREIKLVSEDKKLLAESFFDRVRERELLIYGLYKARIEQLVAAGLCTPIQPSVAVFTILAAINFIYQWYRPHGASKLEVIAEQTVRMLTGGLLVHAPVEANGKRKSRVSRRLK